MIERHLGSRLRSALAESSIVCLQGARQVGKTTLVRSLAGPASPRAYVTLEDASVLAAAGADPQGFVEGLPGPVVLDEAQRVPALLPAVQRAVARRPSPGRFLLTSSAPLLARPELAKAQAAGLQVHTLWPCSQDELEGRGSPFVDELFAARADFPQDTGGGREDLGTRVLRGGFPAACRRRSAEGRRAFFERYVTTVLQRDVWDRAHLKGLSALPRLLTVLAARNATRLNMAAIARDLALPQTTLKRYLALLEGAFLVIRVPAWSRNVGPRLVKAPKLMLSDTALSVALLGRRRTDELPSGAEGERLLEAFVGLELLKQAGWSTTRVRLHHAGDHVGNDVDWVLEDARGRLVGIEVQAASVLGTRDGRGLRSFRERLGKRFHRGVVLYGGASHVPLGPGLHALPFAALWAGAREDPRGTQPGLPLDVTAAHVLGAGRHPPERERAIHLSGTA